MLKIIKEASTVDTLKVSLWGLFTAEYIPEVDQALTRGKNKRLALDLMNVTFVDRAAMEFLRKAKSEQVKVENVPSYVSRWIEQESVSGSTDSYRPLTSNFKARSHTESKS